jgi:hypothetical protein
MGSWSRAHQGNAKALPNACFAGRNEQENRFCKSLISMLISDNSAFI